MCQIIRTPFKAVIKCETNQDMLLGQFYEANKNYKIEKGLKKLMEKLND